MKAYVRSSKAVFPLLAALSLGLGVGACTPKSASADSASSRVTAATVPGAPISSSDDVSSLVSRVQSSVVNITVEQKAQPAAAFDGETPFDFFFRGDPRGPRPEARKQRALGSGFLVDAKGHVVTNAHVIDGADVVRVKLSDEREFKAKVKGKDERLDVAILEIEGAKDLPFATLGSSGALKVGEPVVAIGNPFGLGHTVTKGIVSAKGRAIGAGPYDDFIQTDASINPGNSGGPLFDLRGQVVGMNTAINPAGQGIGFAIPADEIREVLPQLLERGRVDRGKIGAHIQDVDESIAKAMGLGGTRGALVGDVEKNSPAEKAGLRPGDVVTGVDGNAVAHAHELPRLIASHAPGTKVTLDVRRGGSTLKVPVTLEKLDDEATAKAQGSKEARPDSGALGIQVDDAEGGGALVRRVVPGSPAAGALRPGDVIVEVNREPVRSANELTGKMRALPTDKPVLLLVKREGSTRYVAIDRS